MPDAKEEDPTCPPEDAGICPPVTVPALASSACRNPTLMVGSGFHCGFTKAGGVVMLFVASWDTLVATEPLLLNAMCTHHSQQMAVHDDQVSCTSGIMHLFWWYTCRSGLCQGLHRYRFAFKCVPDWCRLSMSCFQRPG